MFSVSIQTAAVNNLGAGLRLQGGPNRQWHTDTMHADWQTFLSKVFFENVFIYLSWVTQKANRNWL